MKDHVDKSMGIVTHIVETLAKKGVPVEDNLCEEGSMCTLSGTSIVPPPES
jgi:hypothetical protein